MASTVTSQTTPMNVRVGGSGFTAFMVEGKPLGFCQSFVYTSPQPVAPPTPVQPMDAPRPIEIAVPAAIGASTVQLTIYELWNSKVWDQFMRIVDAGHTTGINTNRLTQYNDLVEVLIRMANLGNTLSCSRVIYPPFQVQQNKTQFYVDTYHGVKITDIRDDESIDIGTMTVSKQITLLAIKTTRQKVTT